MSTNQQLVGWQSDSGGRNTLDIIESSLLTILACTWSIQHLNVPKLDTEWYWTLATKIKWAVFTVFFPEFILAHAILEFIMAWNSLKLFENSEHFHVKLPRLFRYFYHSGDSSDLEKGTLPTDWTLTHSYFANMGGFYLVEEDQSETSSKSKEDHKGSVEKAHLVQEVNPEKTNNLTNEVIVDQDGPAPTIPSKRDAKQPILLTSHHFAKFGDKFKLPISSEEDLKDKSKTDTFTKAIAVLQILYLFLSLIVRRIRHLAFSQLETITLAFAVCGVITYICCWFKPRDVGRPFPVTTCRPFSFRPGYQHRTFDTLANVLIDRAQTKDDYQLLDRIPNDNVPREAYVLPLLATLAVGFGCMHIIAWKFEFPTVVEKTLWRTATLVSILVPPLALISPLLSRLTTPWGDSDAFTLACLHIMREYYRQSKDESGQVRSAIRTLSESYDGILPDVHYKNIFNLEGDPKLSLGKKLSKFIHDDKGTQKEKSLHPYPDFQRHFDSLIDILHLQGKTRSKILYDKARPELYPRKIWPIAQLANQAIVYASIPVYCIARLSIIAIAFSSLRSMPESVYITTWTGVIPNWA